MVKILKNFALVSALAAAPLMAAKDDGTKSLIGFEGGVSNIKVETSTTPLVDDTFNATHGGIKIGAESKDFRFFLNFNYLDASEFDTATTYGASLQYLLNVSQYMNVFAGVNAGRVDFRLLDSANNVTAVKDTYFGGDLGVNIHLGETMDLELGGRYMNISGKTAAYEVRNAVAGYGSLIFKFQMD